MRHYLSIALIIALAACTPKEKVATERTVTTGTCTALVSGPDYRASGWPERTLPELVTALETGRVTSETLVKDFLKRIEDVDKNGPRLQAILSLNPDAIMQAKEIDRQRKAGDKLGPMAGIPILLKDNIETLDPMPTTAGSMALANNLTRRDAPFVARLRADGAIILGKTNLSQWANFRSNESISGWSAMGGQVRNPHMLDRSPCGSSSGSGAAMAASLAAGTVGTETNGSIICPSNVNGLVGFKPTVGLVSQDLIVPISASQDTAGPMTKTVRGAAMMLSSMATDGSDKNYAAALDAGSLAGKRIGVMRFSLNDNPDINARFEAALSVMETQGAILVDINDYSPPDGFWDSSLSVLEYEFKDGLNAYLAETPDTVTARTLSEIIAFNSSESRELALFDQDLFDESDAKGPLTDEDYITARDMIQTSTRADGIDKFIADENLDMLVSPSGPVSPRVDPVNGDVWPSWAGGGYIAAVAGYPHITVPMGDAHGVPIGLSIMGTAEQDADILSYGYAYEQASQMRLSPQYLPSAESCSDVGAAMTRPTPQ